MPELPDLPVPFGFVETGAYCTESTYDVEQMREFAIQYGEAVREACAKVPTEWGDLPNEEVLKIAPMMGNFSADEVAAFCGGFRRCAQALAATRKDTP